VANKRQPSKQRRQSQNQRQRAALEVRRANAAASPPPAGSSGEGDDGPATDGTTGTSTKPAFGLGSVFSRVRGTASAGRAVRVGDTGGLPVGHRAALSGLLAALAAALVGAFLIKVPVDRAGEPIATPGALVAEWSLSARDTLQDMPDAEPAELADAVTTWTTGEEKPYGVAWWPVSLGLLLPVVGTGLGFRVVARRSTAKIVNRTVIVTLFGTLLAGQLLLIFIPAIAGLAVAAFQVRKAEMAALAAAAPADDVIDVDEVSDDE
jgi:hypothetical protein